MNPTLRSMVRLIVVDPRSRRAIDETALDWITESNHLSSPIGRVSCHFRSTIAMTRALMLCIPREVAHPQIWWVVARAVALTLMPAIIWVAVTGSFSHHPADPLPFAPFDILRLNAWWLSIVLAFLLPFGWFLSAAWAPRCEVSRVGLVLSAFAVSLVFTGWLGPLAARQSYDAMWDRQERIWQLQGLTIESPRRSSGVPTLLETNQMVGSRDHRELQLVRAYTVSLPFLCALLVFLATTLPTGNRWKWAVGVSGALTAQRLIPELLRVPGPLQLRSYFLDVLMFSYVIAIAAAGIMVLAFLRREAVAGESDLFGPGGQA